MGCSQSSSVPLNESVAPLKKIELETSFQEEKSPKRKSLLTKIDGKLFSVEVNTDKSITVAVKPSPGFVIKSQDLNRNKVFVNVWTEPRSTTPFVIPEIFSCEDRKGRKSALFQCLAPTSILLCSPEERNSLCAAIIGIVNSQFQLGVSVDFILPNIGRGFLGEEVPEFLVPETFMVDHSAVVEESELDEYTVVAPSSDHHGAIRLKEIGSFDFEAEELGNDNTDSSTAISTRVTSLQSDQPVESISPPPGRRKSVVETDTTNTAELVVPSPTSSPVVAASKSEYKINTSALSVPVASPAMAPRSTPEIPTNETTLLAKPEMLEFWGMKLSAASGTMKSRYFRLEAGMLKCFAEKGRSEPFGRGLKGTCFLRGHSIKEQQEEQKYTTFTLSGERPEDFIRFSVESEISSKVMSSLQNHVKFANSESADQFFRQALEADSSSRLSGSHFESEAEERRPSLASDVGNVETDERVSEQTNLEATAENQRSKDVVSPRTSVPEQIRFWAQKKGHINVALKTRYFVLDHGNLTYFGDSLEESPPYGKDFKGSFSLQDCTVDPPVESNYSSPESFCLYLHKTDKRDLNLQFTDSALHRKVYGSLLEHIAYVKSLVSRLPARPAMSRAISTAEKRQSIANIFRSPSLAVPTAAASSLAMIANYCLAVEELVEWSVYLRVGEQLVVTSLVTKPAPLGRGQPRQLLLTSQRRLVSVDPSTREVASVLDVTLGKALWPIAKVGESKDVLIVKPATGTSEVKFIDSLYGAQFWVDKISSLRRD